MGFTVRQVDYKIQMDQILGRLDDVRRYVVDPEGWCFSFLRKYISEKEEALIRLGAPCFIDVSAGKYLTADIVFIDASDGSEGRRKLFKVTGRAIQAMKDDLAKCKEIVQVKGL